MMDFLVVQAKDIPSMSTNLAQIPNNRGGRKIGTLVIKKKGALVNWCHNRAREGLQLDATAFDGGTLIKYVRNS